MNENDGSTFSGSNDENNKKLEQYKIINRQLSKRVAEFKIKISNLTNLIKQREMENLDYRNKTFMWKNKFFVLKEMYFEHFTLMTRQLQTNAEKLNTLFDGDEFSENGETKVDRTSLPTSSRSVDSSRRISRAFELPKSSRFLSQAAHDQISLVTIDEESENKTEHEFGRQMIGRPIKGRQTNKVTPVGEGCEKPNVVNEPENECREKSKDKSKEKSREKNRKKSREESREESRVDKREESGNESKDESEKESGEESVEESASVNESGEEPDGEAKEEHQNGNKSKTLEKSSLVSSTYNPTLANRDTNKENEWNSTLVDSKKVPMKKKFASNRNGTRLKLLMENHSFQNLKVSDLASTPYQEIKKNSSKNPRQSIVSQVPQNTIQSLQSRSSAASSSASLSNSALDVIANSLTGRPKRKTTRIIMCEPKLNIKLRRPLAS